MKGLDTKAPVWFTLGMETTPTAKIERTDTGWSYRGQRISKSEGVGTWYYCWINGYKIKYRSLKAVAVALDKVIG